MNKSLVQQKKPKGVLLKETRESKGVSLETVHGATKIPLDVLRAIEEGYTVRTLSTFYMKAFLKKYAAYLGVEISEVVEDYQPERLPDPVRLPREDEEELAVKWEEIFTRDRQQQIAKVVGIVVALFLLTRMIGCLTGRSAEKPKQPVKAAPAAQPEKKSAAQTPKIPTGPAPRTPSPARPAAVVKPKPKKPAAVKPTKLRLTIKAKRKGWLQVKVDGNLVFQSTFKEGVSETWEAKQMIELSGKSIHNLVYEVNGKVLNLGRADRNARRVVVTKNGLTVKR